MLRQRNRNTGIADSMAEGMERLGLSESEENPEGLGNVWECEEDGREGSNTLKLLASGGKLVRTGWELRRKRRRI